MKKFKPYHPEEEIELPSSPQEWLPEGHIVYFLSEVVDQLDLSAVYQSYQRGDDRGQPPYDPRMMVKVLLYSYCIGKVSSRKIERATYEEAAYRILACNQHPDHDSIAEFRKRHLEALAGLFLQVLRMCQEAGLVKLGYIALDGTKMEANASKHKAMSYGRMEETEQKLTAEIEQIKAEIERLLEAARKADEEEEKGARAGRREEKLPEELKRRENRLKKIKEAKASLEEEARAAAEEKATEQQEKREERQRQEEERGKKAGGRPPKVIDPAEVKPEAKAQRNFTDPDSRIMPVEGGKSFIQGYNAQAAVDQGYQIIVASAITQDTNDKKQLVGMLGMVKENAGTFPQQAAADSGYFSAAQVSHPSLKEVELYVAVDRQKHSEESYLETLLHPTTATTPALPQPTATQPTAAAPKAVTSEAVTSEAEVSPAEMTHKSHEEIIEEVRTKMREKLKEAVGRAAYALRKSIVEAVFGQIKGHRGIDRFSFRGEEKVAHEWDLICLTHNLLKLFRYGGYQAS